MKTILIFVLLGALVGAAAASLIVPPTLAWYNEAGFLSQPGQNQVQALVNIPQVVRYATTRLIKGQLIGAAIGAAVFLVFGLLVSRRRVRRAAVPPSPAPPARSGPPPP
jgi:hypothetical protein